MYFLIAILTFLYLALRLVKRKESRNLNHRKSFKLKSYKKKQED